MKPHSDKFLIERIAMAIDPKAFNQRRDTARKYAAMMYAERALRVFASLLPEPNNLIRDMNVYKMFSDFGSEKDVS